MYTTFFLLWFCKAACSTLEVKGSGRKHDLKGNIFAAANSDCFSCSLQPAPFHSSGPGQTWYQHQKWTVQFSAGENASTTHFRCDRSDHFLRWAGTCGFEIIFGHFTFIDCTVQAWHEERERGKTCRKGPRTPCRILLLHMLCERKYIGLYERPSADHIWPPTVS